MTARCTDRSKQTTNSNTSTRSRDSWLTQFNQKLWT